MNAKDTTEATDAVFGDPTARRFSIVAIGASAGGLEAFETFFNKMPPDRGMTFIFIQHLDPSHRSMLPELVAKFTTMQVYEITDGLEVAPNFVYIIPPDRDLGILHGALYLLEPPERRGLRHPIDAFFRSLALEQGDKAIGIIVSGTGTEGTLGWVSATSRQQVDSLSFRNLSRRCSVECLSVQSEPGLPKGG